MLTLHSLVLWNAKSPVWKQWVWDWTAINAKKGKVDLNNAACNLQLCFQWSALSRSRNTIFCLAQVLVGDKGQSFDYNVFVFYQTCMQHHLICWPQNWTGTCCYAKCRGKLLMTDEWFLLFFITFEPLLGKEWNVHQETIGVLRKYKRMSRPRRYGTSTTNWYHF